MDRNLTIGYYSTAAIAAILTLLASVALAFMIDNLIVSKTNTPSTTIPFIIIIALGTRYILNFLSGIFQWSLNQLYYDYLFRYKLQNYLAYKFYKKVSHLDIAHLEDPKTQDLIVKARDTMLWQPADFLRGVSFLFSNLVTFVSAFIILLPFGWWIPAIITVSTIPILILRTKYGSLQWSIYGSGAPEVKKLYYFTWLLSTTTAIREMKIFKSSEELISKLKNTQEYLYQLNKKPVDNYLKLFTIPPLFEILIIVAIAYYHLPPVLSGIITVGSFTLLINMMDSLISGAESAVIGFGDFYSRGLYVDYYFSVLSLPKIIKDKEHPHIFERIMPPKIEFRNVSFAYPNGTQVLNDVSFVINPHENAAFVGDNGAGKSTIIKLLCRFYDVTSGEILINGINLRDVKLSNWYDFLGTLFQDFVQYHFTVRENIALGNPDKKSEVDIIEASKKSGAYEFIKKLPDKFDTILGREFEEGEELSIGQWQKLAIARAFYEEAPVLILDEPTSAIDAEAEYEIFTNLEKEYRNKTLILVSHRFSTVRNADKIYVVENGEITEQGTHEELLKLNGKYASMFLTQAKGYQ